METHVGPEMLQCYHTALLNLLSSFRKYLSENGNQNQVVDLSFVMTTTRLIFAGHELQLFYEWHLDCLMVRRKICLTGRDPSLRMSISS